ncbi:nicotinate phosphoribosyltransferase [Legionella micdadei]|uniref:Nicotinate phosphoribosyltransferase n=1 Tax=Legionella micdadei TaxID=451 RepID=A0A098GBG3_LEGMI|nr:nicotinate phosphoribosyltransferase [Legionella micdadei]ARG98472.1 nicotinate phosphoribosyltransferase [Legionella micdadei]ARH01217.1 nicotinate phosphoribosyltransferase [Legionella micdadei]KTD30316.1 nicotinate phosphoribosyltransferase [Legionella micdadei]CEG59838.1 Nicotinate phosphoribosyltransferase [Legionella micdadei]SCY51790.1 nicotinate phosphoribosyltransferase [Legionella micdadei]
MINYTATYTDKYQLTMAQVYFLKGQKNHVAMFDYFFRKLPFGGGYAIFAGLEDLLGILENFSFNQSDIAYLHTQGFHSDFLNYLENFKFKGTVYASQEGDLVFPTCPVVTVEADIIEAQLVETILLNVLNFQTLIATKASRMRHVAGQRELIDFGLRRAQGPGGYYASRAAIIGGFNSTSNVCCGRDYHTPISGTMAHSFVQSYDDELSAFRDFAECWADNCVLLVDTYSTLESGVPNAIIIGKEMEARGQKLKGIRLDSGDLAYLAKRARDMLDEAGLDYVKITASNQLNEEVIKSLLEQEAPIDSFGVGTNLVIGAPDAALDGVYKLAFANHKPRIKLSETLSKITLPYKKQTYRVLEADGIFLGADVIALAEEEDLDMMFHPFEEAKSFSLKNYKKEPLLHKVMEKGKRLFAVKTLNEIAEYSQQRLALLPDEYKRLINPHNYKVGLSYKLKLQREQLIQKMKA